MATLKTMTTKTTTENARVDVQGRHEIKNGRRPLIVTSLLQISPEGRIMQDITVDVFEKMKLAGPVSTGCRIRGRGGLYSIRAAEGGARADSGGRQLICGEGEGP